MSLHLSLGSIAFHLPSRTSSVGSFVTWLCYMLCYTIIGSSLQPPVSFSLPPFPVSKCCRLVVRGAAFFPATRCRLHVQLSHTTFLLHFANLCAALCKELEASAPELVLHLPYRPDEGYGKSQTLLPEDYVSTTAFHCVFGSASILTNHQTQSHECMPSSCTAVAAIMTRVCMPVF
jgi:hypothetical protein